MTKLLQEAIDQIRQLPPDKQDAIATKLLAELQDEKKSDNMAQMVDQEIAQEFLSLPSSSRALLAEKLVESLEFDTDPDVQSAWLTEAQKRKDEVRSGIVEVISGEDALAQVRQILK